MRRVLAMLFLCLLLVGGLFLGIFLLSGHSEPEVPAPYADFMTYPEVIIAEGDDEALIRRGEYLAKMGDCIACHTREAGKAFAGGRAMHTPFGTFYAPNITPSEQYGIGRWREEDLQRAMRHGIAPDGSYYFPVFPFLYYSKVSEADIQALSAYFHAIPAIDEPSWPHEVGFPFNIRFLQLGWRMLFYFPYEREFVVDPDASEIYNRGKYIAEGLAHCGMCHTPINFLGGPKRWLAYTGNTVDGWHAPNITGTQLKNITEAALVHLFQHNEKPGGRGMIQGPMREVNEYSLRFLSEEDLYAIAHYIKSTEDHSPPVTVDSSDHLGMGKSIYDWRCAACHDMGAGGAPKLSDQADWLQRQQKGLDVLYHNVIHGYNAMPARGFCASKEDSGCDDAAMHAAVDYIYSVQHGPAAIVRRPEPPKAITTTKAKMIYESTCATCHQEGQLNAPKLGDRQAWRPRAERGFDVLLGNVLWPLGKPEDSTACVLAKGGCETCSTAEIIAVVKYILAESTLGRDYRLW